MNPLSAIPPGLGIPEIRPDLKAVFFRVEPVCAICDASERFERCRQYERAAHLAKPERLHTKTLAAVGGLVKIDLLV